MAFEAKSIDEENTGICDTYDSLITPRRIFRNNNNKFYLMFKSIAAGFSKLRDVVLALKYRFDPRYCEEDDLESAMLITGEKRIPGKSSMLRIIVTNTSTAEQKVLVRGVYVFKSSDGAEFRYTVQEDTIIAPLGFEVLLFTSVLEGSFPVVGEASASVSRADAVPISNAFNWETLDNAQSLGRSMESMFDVRKRILTDTTRQDSLKEMETAIKALPSIFECNLIFNPESTSVALDDGTLLLPKELLVVITGAPSPELAATVLAKEIYKTHMVTYENTVWYYNNLFLGGRYPVHYRFHDRKPFYLTINYRYDRQKLSKEQVEAAYSQILNKYKVMTNHIDEITEPLLYREFENSSVAGATLKKIYIQVEEDGSLVSVAQVDIPKLYIPELISINYISEEAVSGSQ